MDKSFLRSLIFRHLDGIVTAPVLSTLASKGILHYIVVNKKTNLSQLSEQFHKHHITKQKIFKMELKVWLQ